MGELNFKIVVLDGANIIHNRKKNSEGKRELTLEPKRLLSAIEHCEGKGWKTVAALKQGTYWFAETNPDILEEGDFEILENLIDDGKITLISQKDEDIYWIDFALESDGYIITRDSFKDRMGEKRERSLYPDRPWDKIDRRTLSYSFISGRFICSDLPKKPDFVPEGSQKKLQEEIEELKRLLNESQAEVRALTSKQKAGTLVQTSYDQEIVNIFENLLGDGEEIATSIVYNELARNILKLPEDMMQWPPNWPKTLKERLGFPRNKKYTSFFEDLSQIVTNHTSHRIQFDSTRSKVKYVV